jgi:hypothetical protein
MYAWPGKDRSARKSKYRNSKAHGLMLADVVFAEQLLRSGHHKLRVHFYKDQRNFKKNGVSDKWSRALRMPPCWLVIPLIKNRHLIIIGAKASGASGSMILMC